MPEDISKELDLDVKKTGSHGDKSQYQQLRTVRTELDLVKYSEDLENDLLEASLEEYQ